MRLKHMQKEHLKTHTWKPVQNIDNIQIKYLQYIYKTYVTSK
jgi:hypothetical protein